MAPKRRLGKLPPRYSFLLNPREDLRFTRCPQCDERTRLRKFALFVYVDGFGAMVLGKTCRFCARCELVIVHGDELEHELAVALETRAPAAIGNEYGVLGTVDRKVWRKGLGGDTEDLGNDLLDHIADFKRELELKYEPGGWYPP